LPLSAAPRMARLKREAEEEETCLIEALMDADRLHDAGYESAEQYSHVLEQVRDCMRLNLMASDGL
jgi:hypothetical protein